MTIRQITAVKMAQESFLTRNEQIIKSPLGTPFKMAKIDSFGQWKPDFERKRSNFSGFWSLDIITSFLTMSKFV